MVSPVSMLTTHTPQVRSFSRWTSGMPLKTALSRTCERPIKASGPIKSMPRVKPGTSATVRHVRASRSTSASVPSPDSSTQSLPRCQRGECGIERPRSKISLVSMSIRMPPWALLARQPPALSVSPSAVTYLGRPSTMARPFRWQRSSGARPLRKGGRQRGLKLCAASSVQRQQNLVLTTHNSSWESYASSWMSMSPVTWMRRGR